MDDLIERRGGLHRRFGGSGRCRFGDLRFAMGYVPRRDVAFGTGRPVAWRSAMGAALVRRDVPVEGAGIALAKEELGQGDRRAETVEHAVIDADGGAAMAADDDLRMRGRDQQRAETRERDDIPAPAKGPHTAKMKASRKAEGHQTESHRTPRLTHESTPTRGLSPPSR
jgi:hypothetical protein